MSGHKYEKRIYYHDTDCGGVVYYANYLKYLEEARTELFSQLGISLRTLAMKGMGFAVARVNLEYKAPSRYQDTLTVNTLIEKIKLSAIQFHQTIFRGGSLLVEAHTTIVFVGEDFKPLRMPEEIRSLLP